MLPNAKWVDWRSEVLRIWSLVWANKQIPSTSDLELLQHSPNLSSPYHASSIPSTNTNSDTRTNTNTIEFPEPEWDLMLLSDTTFLGNVCQFQAKISSQPNLLMPLLITVWPGKKLSLCFLFLFACLFVGNGTKYERWAEASPIVDLRKKRSRDAPRHFFSQPSVRAGTHYVNKWCSWCAGTFTLWCSVCNVTDPWKDSRHVW